MGGGGRARVFCGGMAPGSDMSAAKLPVLEQVEGRVLARRVRLRTVQAYVGWIVAVFDITARAGSCGGSWTERGRARWWLAWSGRLGRSRLCYRSSYMEMGRGWRGVSDGDAQLWERRSSLCAG